MSPGVIEKCVYLYRNVVSRSPPDQSAIGGLSNPASLLPVPIATGGVSATAAPGRRSAFLRPEIFSNGM